MLSEVPEVSSFRLSVGGQIGVNEMRDMTNSPDTEKHAKKYLRQKVSYADLKNHMPIE